MVSTAPAPAVRADVGIHDGRIVTVGVIDERGDDDVDAATRGRSRFIDLHTHYDAQLF
jgi:N-acyl-D-aspartate/D-glutamate deacylase